MPQLQRVFLTVRNLCTHTPESLSGRILTHRLPRSPPTSVSHWQREGRAWDTAAGSQHQSKLIETHMMHSPHDAPDTHILRHTHCRRLELRPDSQNCMFNGSLRQGRHPVTFPPGLYKYRQAPSLSQALLSGTKELFLMLPKLTRAGSGKEGASQAQGGFSQLIILGKARYKFHGWNARVVKCWKEPQRGLRTLLSGKAVGGGRAGKG